LGFPGSRQQVPGLAFKRTPFCKPATSSFRGRSGTRCSRGPGERESRESLQNLVKAGPRPTISHAFSANWPAGQSRRRSEFGLDVCTLWLGRIRPLPHQIVIWEPTHGQSPRGDADLTPLAGPPTQLDGRGGGGNSEAYGRLFGRNRNIPRLASPRRAQGRRIPQHQCLSPASGKLMGPSR